MYIAIDDETVTPQRFIVCEFYGTETCFCWDADKLVIFPYKAIADQTDKTARDVRLLSTPAPVKQVQCFNGRIFVICVPQGVYKLSRNGAFALLSKNALGMGAEYCQVLIAKGNGIYVDNKQIKSSKLLFKYPTASNAIEEIYTFPLILEDTEEQFLKCFTSEQQIKKNICVIGYNEKLFVLLGDHVQLIYTIDAGTISHIAPVKRENKVMGLLLFVNIDTVILVHGKDHNLFFDKVYLGRNMRSTSVLCASFDSQLENVLWIVYCDRSKMYYVRKELFIDTVQEVKVEERTFACIQYYRSNVMLGLSEEKELVEFPLETLETSFSINNNLNLCTNMFQKTDSIVEQICKKVKELDALYARLADEQDRLRRINLYASKWKLQINPSIEIFRVWNNNYITVSIPGKLPKNTYIVLVFTSNNQNTFCVKKVEETTFTIKMSINENKVLCSSTVNMDLITLMNEEAPWCLLRNFINCPSQKEMRKRRPKKDKTTFINAKIALLQNLIAKEDLDMKKLCEIKKIVRTEL